MIKSITIDFTSLNTWRSCPQKFAYRTMHSLVPAHSSPALEFGKLIHFGIEQLNLLGAIPSLAALEEIEYLAAGNPPVTTDDYSDALIHVLHLTTLEAFSMALCKIVPDERRSLRHLLTLLVRYCEKWHPDPLLTNICEKKHKMYVGDTHSGIHIFYTGTMDGFKDGKVLERKTTSYLNTTFIDRINPNAQASGYIALARDLYQDSTIDTCIFDAISTAGYGKSYGSATSNPKRWTINTKPNDLFMRLTTYRSDAQLAEWKANLLYDCERIAQDIIRGRYSTNQPDACTAYNSTCPYIDACNNTGDVRTSILSTAFNIEEWPSFAINAD